MGVLRSLWSSGVSMFVIAFLILVSVPRAMLEGLQEIGRTLLDWLNSAFPVGTRSVLYGAHCFFIHPFFVAAAWRKLYGTPKDWRLWAAFFLHDLGYVGKPNMDGPEGESHVEWGARALERLVYWVEKPRFRDTLPSFQEHVARRDAQSWYEFSLYHSRFIAKRDRVLPSPLCMADKLAVALEPAWLYLPRVFLSGELWEYMSRAGGKDGGKYAGEKNSPEVAAALERGTIRSWHFAMTTYCRQWAETHKDGREDTWTANPASAPKEDPSCLE